MQQCMDIGPWKNCGPGGGGPLHSYLSYRCELPPKLYCPKMEYIFFLRFKGSPSFYKGFDQNFSDIRAISRSHHFELMAAAMAKVIKKTVPGCARISTVTRRSDKGARRSNSGSASSRSSSSSSGVAVAGAAAVAVPVAAAAVAAAVAPPIDISDSSDSSHSKSQQQLPAATSSY